MCRTQGHSVQSRARYFTIGHFKRQLAQVRCLPGLKWRIYNPTRFEIMQQFSCVRYPYSLQALYGDNFFQVLNGDIDEAICSHALYYSIWRKYESLPERYNWVLRAPDVLFYPLRPELVESTYFLYQATKNPFYLHVGKDILDSLNIHTRAW